MVLLSLEFSTSCLVLGQQFLNQNFLSHKKYFFRLLTLLRHGENQGNVGHFFKIRIKMKMKVCSGKKSDFRALVWPGEPGSNPPPAPSTCWLPGFGHTVHGLHALLLYNKHRNKDFFANDM